jgi:hypothetical protein
MNTKTTPSPVNMAAATTTPARPKASDASSTASGDDASFIAGAAHSGDSSDYPLVSARDDEKTTIVDVRGVPLGAGVFQMIAGPCAVESKDQLFRIAEVAKRCGASSSRRGVQTTRGWALGFASWKPRPINSTFVLRKQRTAKRFPRWPKLLMSSDRLAEHAELRCWRPWAGCTTGSAEARHGGKAGGAFMTAEYIVARAIKRDALRARHPHLRPAIPLA